MLPVDLQKVLSVGTGALVDQTFKGSNQVDTAILLDTKIEDRGEVQGVEDRKEPFVSFCDLNLTMTTSRTKTSGNVSLIK